MRILVSAFDCVDFMQDFSEILQAKLKFEQIWAATKEFWKLGFCLQRSNSNSSNLTLGAKFNSNLSSPNDKLNLICSRRRFLKKILAKSLSDDLIFAGIFTFVEQLVGLFYHSFHVFYGFDVKVN